MGVYFEAEPSKVSLEITISPPAKKKFICSSEDQLRRNLNHEIDLDQNNMLQNPFEITNNFSSNPKIETEQNEYFAFRQIDSMYQDEVGGTMQSVL